MLDRHSPFDLRRWAFIKPVGDVLYHQIQMKARWGQVFRDGK
jgi:hypothetical protein